ncbi:MAG TPA: chemotaxis response regulator protein-glutamate methylesterase [Anaeromyxobacteraceae bacterium]|nr:chemotaxis response regulator protein-glutamate methylesterase [Anaeromyxobacteraceae bacterium]
MSEPTARTAGPRPIRVMVVDDSAPNRRAVAGMLAAEADVEVVAEAADGEDGLRQALVARPDVICLDLAMPRMDGFTFLRLLMARQPTPVIVVSSFNRKADVFKALELGALDFVAKPEGGPGRLGRIRAELVQKVRTVRALRIETLERRAHDAGAGPDASPDPQASPRAACLGASTGGPPALQRILTDLPGNLPMAVLVAQHMPERFTRAFADRVARLADFRVAEAEDGQVLQLGRAYVAPGGRHLSLEAGRPAGAAPRVRVTSPRPGERRYCPSIDLLFESAARVLGNRVCAVVLTGMGNDGRDGLRLVKEAGGLTLAESEETAVVYGMPREAAASGRVDEVVSLDAMAARLVRFAHGR